MSLTLLQPFQVVLLVLGFLATMCAGSTSATHVTTITMNHKCYSGQLILVDVKNFRQDVIIVNYWPDCMFYSASSSVSVSLR